MCCRHSLDGVQVKHAGGTSRARRETRVHRQLGAPKFRPSVPPYPDDPLDQRFDTLLCYLARRDSTLQRQVKALYWRPELVVRERSGQRQLLGRQMHRSP